MQELLVLSGNPSRRHRRHKRRAKRAKSHRRHRKMTALQRAYFGGARLAHNPGKRRRRRRSSTSAHRRGSRRRSQGFARMGLFKAGAGSLAKPMSMIGPALTGALGAVAVNTVLAKLPLPTMLQTGKTRFLTQGVAAIALGTLASRFGALGAGTAAKMAEGALIVTLHDAIKEFAGDAGVNLGGMGYYLPARSSVASPSASGAPARNMGRYLTGPGSAPGSVVPLRRGVGNINTFKF